MRHIFVTVLLLLSLAANAVSLRADYPGRYVVRPGDTLWSIANQYLQKPWEWKALWHANPQVHNPNRLYPGDILILNFYKRSPYLKVLPNGTIKLSPVKRPQPLSDPVPPIPLSDIKPFLNSSLVLDQNCLANAPYVLAYSGERLLGGQGDEVYVKNLKPDPALSTGATLSYAIFREGGPYLEPVTERLLGYKAILVGYGELLRSGEPATLLLTTIYKGVRLADRILPNIHPEFSLHFEPQAPGSPVNGSIIDILGDFNQGAAGLVAVIDRGKDCALKAGDVLGIYSKPRIVRDPVQSDLTVELPRERIGEIMVFRSFTHTSFALVVRSIRAVHIMDSVGNP